MEAFWNIAGMRNKDKGFWDRIREWDVITLMETWVDEKGWRKVKNWLPKGFKWGVQFASKKNKKGRAMGGMIMEIKGRGRIEMGEIETGEEGMMIGKWKEGKEEWKIVGIYVNEDLEKKNRGIKEINGRERRRRQESDNRRRF